MPIVDNPKAMRLGKIIQAFMNRNLDNFARRIIQTYGYDPIEMMYNLDEMEKAVKKQDEREIENILSRLENRQKNFR
ncbi:MAG: hypothetical protein UV01_C0003G0073 [Parcubacteria group bacterium GW2011_GWA2_42_14]|nr:MAG: hypothetical protein UV01_C0003G0073 [Parcubacteria group bacterium GW2011_GWA2_42_14]